MPLSDVQIRSAKHDPARTLKLSDGGGLQLWITPTGSRLWHLAYRHGGKQRKLAFGPYPGLGLKAARERREEARQLLAKGVDPGDHKKANRAAKANAAANTFAASADQLIARKIAEKRSKATMDKVRWLLGVAKETLGSRPISEIGAPEILDMLRPIQARGHHETAKRLRSTVSEVFRLAVANGHATTDPTFALRGALVTVKATPRAAIVDAPEFGALLRAIDGYAGSEEVRVALQLLALTFVRPGELRAAEWSEFDMRNAVWSIPAAKMKMRAPHHVPLAPRALAILDHLRTLQPTGSTLLFPSTRGDGRPMSENTLNAALRRLGFGGDEHTAHGFRASASTLLNESGLFNPDAIEAALAHADRNQVRAIYNRSPYWTERVRMASWWSSYLDEVRSGGEVSRGNS